MKDGRPLDFARESGHIAAAGLAFLPEPQSCGLEVQKHFEMPSPTWVDGEHIGFGYQGYLDLWLPTGGMPNIGLPFDPVVCDFKTTGNWKYAKTPEQLATDVQAQLYATWAMYTTKSEVVDLVWIYFATKGPRKAKRVHLRVHSDHVAEQFSAINDTAIEMYGVRQSCSDPLELPPTLSMCAAYGGCPYQANCNLSPSQKADVVLSAHWAKRAEVSMSNEPKVGLLARLKAGKGSAPPAPEAAPVVAAVGINPPESLLPPAPPVGAVSNPPASTLAEPVADFAAQVAASGANDAGHVKAKRGRPAGSKNGAQAATDFIAAIESGTLTGLDEAIRHQRIGALVVELVSLLGVQ